MPVSAADAWTQFAKGWHTPPTHAFAITPDDANQLTEITRAIYVGGGGDIALILAEDSAPVIFKAVPTGALLEMRVLQVKATNTTATLLIGLY